MSDVLTVAARRERVEEIGLRLAEIDTEFSGGAMTDEARQEWEELLEERTQHQKAIEDAEAREKILEQIAGDNAKEKPGFEDDDEPTKRSLGTERVTSVSPAKQVRAANGTKVKDIYNLEEYRRAVSNVDELPGLYKEGARRAIESAVIPGYGVDADKAKETAERLLETVDDKHGTLARRILETGSERYQRAFGKAVMGGGTMGLTPEEQRALQAGVGADGGFAVPFTLDPTVLLASDGSINPLRQISRVVQITTSTWQGVTSAGITVTRAAENDEATDDAPALAQPEVTPTRVHGFVPFSIEVDQDWGALRSEMTTLLQDAKDQEEASSFATGDGVDPNPNGVVSTLAATSEVATATAGTFASEDVYAVEEALPPRFRARGRWTANKSIYNAVRQFAAADGHDLWERIGAGQPPELLGYPAHELSSMASAVTLGNRILLFGDFQQFIIVDRVGMSVELVPHLFGATNRFPTGQRGLYAIWRNSSLVLVPNAFRVLEVA